MPVGIGTAISSAVGLGLGTTAAGVLGGSLLGAAGGAAISGITGGNPLTGALGGLVTGGFGGAASGIAGDLGITSVGGETALGAGLGAAGGAIGSAITGGNPLTGAATGGVLGGIEGFSSAPGTGSASAPGTASAPGITPPAGVAGTPVDLTQLGSNTSGLNLFTPSADVSGTGNSELINALNSEGTTATNLANSGSGFTLGSNIGASGITDTGTSDITSQLQAVQSQFGDGSGAASGTADTSSGGGGLLSSLTSAIGKNPLGAVAAGGGLLLNMLQGSSVNKEISQLKGQANSMQTQGNALASYLQSGTLPAGLQTLVNQAAESAKAQVRSAYASMGLTGSTQEATALGQVAQNATIQTAQIGESLLTTGINEADLSSQLLEGVIGAQTKQSQLTAQSISGLAAALAGSPSKNGITLNFPGGTST